MTVDGMRGVEVVVRGGRLSGKAQISKSAGRLLGVMLNVKPEACRSILLSRENGRQISEIVVMRTYNPPADYLRFPDLQRHAAEPQLA